ncbi:MAG: hypothetical protein MZV70_57590 [Desulfobacterales bacterium]|nr:hypothetical protein [Desulfobacterales bacterium]
MAVTLGAASLPALVFDGDRLLVLVFSYQHIHVPRCADNVFFCTTSMREHSKVFKVHAQAPARCVLKKATTSSDPTRSQW